MKPGPNGRPVRPHRGQFVGQLGDGLLGVYRFSLSRKGVLGIGTDEPVP